MRAESPKYGGRHQRIRAELQPLVDTGQAYCAERICLYPSRWIKPGTAWDLAHADGNQYRGPAHAKCNRSEGATRGNRKRAHPPRRTTRPTASTANVTSRPW